MAYRHHRLAAIESHAVEPGHAFGRGGVDAELWLYRGEMQAIGFARLLIYLQIIVLFQKKDARSYWLLIMLSLLQVVVAALFSQGIFFGLMLIIYMLIASLGLTLLLFQRQWEEFFRGEKQQPAVTRRWPLAGQKSEFQGAGAGDIDLGLGRELYGRLAGIGMRTLGVTVLLFIFLPRFGQVGWIGSILETRQTVGFSDKVDLGEFGQIIENPGEVMRIRFYDQDNGAPYNVHGAIYLRGAVLLNYRRGQWSVGRPAMAVGNPTLQRQDPLPEHLVRQECIIEGLDSVELFYVAPYVALYSDLYVTVDESRLRLLRFENIRTQRFRYELGTTALVDGRQRLLIPVLRGEELRRGHANSSAR